MRAGSATGPCERTLVLASGSPRRRALLDQLGLRFDVVLPDVDESVPAGEPAVDYVCRLSLEKAAAVQQGLEDSYPDAVIVAADTTVVLDGNILGKPASKSEGISMLQRLSGRSHQVLTGVTVADAAHSSTFFVESLVTFRALAKAEINSYWETGEPADKAGGYGLQGIGAVFVSAISGSYTNVIGLPLAETVVLLRQYGIACLGLPGSEPAGKDNSFRARQSHD